MEHFEPSNYFIRDWFAPLSAIGELLLTLTNIYIYIPHTPFTRILSIYWEISETYRQTRRHSYIMYYYILYIIHRDEKTEWPRPEIPWLILQLSTDTATIPCWASMWLSIRVHCHWSNGSNRRSDKTSSRSQTPNTHHTHTRRTPNANFVPKYTLFCLLRKGQIIYLK